MKQIDESGDAELADYLYDLLKDAEVKKVESELEQLRAERKIYRELLSEALDLITEDPDSFDAERWVVVGKRIIKVLSTGESDVETPE